MMSDEISRVRREHRFLYWILVALAGGAILSLVADCDGNMRSRELAERLIAELDSTTEARNRAVDEIRQLDADVRALMSHVDSLEAARRVR